jgi:hypothetical protein
LASSRAEEGEEKANQLLSDFMAECEMAVATSSSKSSFINKLTATDSFFLVLSRKGSG